MRRYIRRKKKSVRPKSKLSLSAYFRSWDLPDYIIKTGKTALRYRSPLEKGIYWYHFSRFIRDRDLKKWGTCISCGKPIEDGDCGHFIAASKCGIELLFDERNNNLECSQCNAWDETHLLGYERGLDARYGPGTAAALKDRYFTRTIQKEWTKERYIELLAQLGITQQPYER